MFLSYSVSLLLFLLSFSFLREAFLSSFIVHLHLHLSSTFSVVLQLNMYLSTVFYRSHTLELDTMGDCHLLNTTHKTTIDHEDENANNTRHGDPPHTNSMEHSTIGKQTNKQTKDTKNKQHELGFRCTSVKHTHSIFLSSFPTNSNSINLYLKLNLHHHVCVYAVVYPIFFSLSLSLSLSHCASRSLSISTFASVCLCICPSIPLLFRVRVLVLGHVSWNDFFIRGPFFGCRQLCLNSHGVLKVRTVMSRSTSLNLAGRCRTKLRVQTLRSGQVLMNRMSQL